jgi:hypothetical protein
MRGSVVLKSWRLDKIFNDSTLSAVTLHNHVLLGWLCAALAVDVAFLAVLGFTGWGTQFHEYDATCTVGSDIIVALYVVSKILLIAVASFLAYRLRKVPDSFNESLAVGVSAMNTYFAAFMALILDVFIVDLSPAPLMIMQLVCALYAVCFNMFALFGPKLWATYSGSPILAKNKYGVHIPEMVGRRSRSDTADSSRLADESFAQPSPSNPEELQYHIKKAEDAADEAAKLLRFSVRSREDQETKLRQRRKQVLKYLFESEYLEFFARSATQQSGSGEHLNNPTMTALAAEGFGGVRLKYSELSAKRLGSVIERPSGLQ